jgi:hypothetical protein
VAEFPEIPAGFGVPLVDLATDLLPTPTMSALDARYPTPESVAELEEVIEEGRLSEPELSATFVTVRTSDGHTLPPATVVVITLDKTLAEVTATPVADIADITFEEV